MEVTPQIHESWLSRLKSSFEWESFRELKRFLLEEKKNRKMIFPPGPQIFAALDSTPFEEVRVVILGQDPYHGPNQAHGMCFSVCPPEPAPPSLVNIFRELKDDLGCEIPGHGDLTHWAKQGVLLLNTVLTVRAHQAASHRGKGWEPFTDEIIRRLSQEHESLVFFLWGRDARNKKPLIDLARHCVLESPHPSPLSAHRGFFGSRPFSRANEFLRLRGRTGIDWQIPV